MSKDKAQEIRDSFETEKVKEFLLVEKGVNQLSDNNSPRKVPHCIKRKKGR